ncbi:hypothetical protein EK21DRAFT_92462 [Setomelanomma holmii]|uniref:Uncharacterized protein n=1 Tax=Setomelanomma holmii TaxID=210430 RepID=A0A9P4LH30_9PLEO|nr:hypothetical protein EK21DRAFT_92462 [Setomelanomma holmii]
MLRRATPPSPLDPQNDFAEALSPNTTKFGIDKEIFRTLTDTWSIPEMKIESKLVGKFRKHEDKEDDGEVEDGTLGGHNVLLRRKPSFNPATRQLHINFDLTAIFPRKLLLDIVYDVFARNGDKADGPNLPYCNIPVFLGNFLGGLRVHCAYIPPSTEDIEAGRKGNDLSGDFRTHNNNLNRGRVFQIKDVKWPDEVDKLTVEGFDEPFSVNDYFDKVIHDDDLRDRDSKIRIFPLVAEHKNNWFPLDRLILGDFHAYKKLDPVVNELRGKGKYFHQFDKRMERTYSKELFKAIAKARDLPNGKEKRDLFIASVEDDDVDCLLMNAAGRRLISADAFSLSFFPMFRSSFSFSSSGFNASAHKSVFTPNAATVAAPLPPHPSRAGLTLGRSWSSSSCCWMCALVWTNSQNPGTGFAGPP